jgi:uncharacterized protein (TIGR02246 family)
VSNEEQALHQIVEQLESAWNRGDSVAWADLFAEDADFIHILGGRFIGRSAIERGHRIIFDTIYKGSTNKFVVEKVRFVGDRVAIVFVFATLKLTAPGMPPQINARPTLVAERRDGTWRIVVFQNTLVTPEGAPTGKDPIADQHPIKGLAKAIHEVLPRTWRKKRNTLND